MTRLRFLGAAISLWMTVASASAQTGVSDDRVSLPEGPGSVDGFSDNATVSGNMGMMSYTIPVTLPSGYAGLTPQVTLAYSSSTGNTALGMGWDISVSSIERTTIRGLPKYDASDEFAADGGSQLVEVETSGVPEYRARFEKGFVRYRWHGRGDGTEGYWTAEYPDGMVGYFGADKDGNLVASARSSKASGPGTFRYYLHEKVDPFGHVLRYNYRQSVGDGGSQPILASIHYGPTVDNQVRYRVELTYQDRDDLILDCKAGFCEQLADRLRLIDVFAGDTAIRRYVLGYEQAGGAGLSRLTKVERKGSDGSDFPAVFTFDYSRSIGEQCSGCEGPYLVDMSGDGSGSGADIGQGYATILDINGDALPDLLDTRSGEHTFYLNVLEDGGNQYFAAGVRSSITEQTGFELNNPNTQVLDVDGDGFVDVVNRLSQKYLRNTGAGDWASYESIADGSSTPDFAADFDAGDSHLAHIRFLDYDNDKRIDIIRSLEAGGTTVYRNTGDGMYEVDANAADIGYGFDGGNLQFSDMNGDGLLDPVRVLEGSIQYRLNWGWAQWGPWQTINLDISSSEVPLVELEDLNGDELSDVLIVQNDVIRYALNRNGGAYDDWVTLSEVDGTALPTRGPSTAVLYADMNANGSTDIVWADNSGLMTYLELFPVRPNLLNLIENGLGASTVVTYGTSAEHQARAGGSSAWKHKLSHAMVVVDKLDQWELLGNEHEVRSFSYSDGFYDGLEKRFRGFEAVEESLAEDTAQQGGRTVSAYDLGVSDPYYASLLKQKDIYSIVDGSPVELQSTVFEHDDCSVAQASSLSSLAIRHVCETRARITLKEGAASSDWQTMENRKAYNGYGRVTLDSALGVVGYGADGSGACPACTGTSSEYGSACGDGCLGDEKFTSTTYIEPGNDTGDAWFLDKAAVVQVRGEAGSDLFTEEKTYYDGDDYVGLATGKLTAGLVSRVTHRVDSAGKTVNTQRKRYDSHGNQVEFIDPNGLLDGTSNRRKWTYDGTGLRITRTEILNDDSEGTPYSLVREYKYDPDWDKPIEASSWMVEADGKIESDRNSEYFGYDVFGRTAYRVLLGGDTPESPTEAYQYDLGSPVSTVTSRRRSKVGGDYDLVTITCIDGRGREVQSKTQIESGRYQASGFTTFNARGKQTRVYLPYISTTAECTDEPPTDVPYAGYRYDGTGRLIQVTQPDSELHDGASVTRTSFLPLRAISYDEEDTDAKSSHADTPTITVKDGQGRSVALRRILSKDGSYSDIVLRYDALGHLTGYEDADGNKKTQTHDLLGRVLQVKDPNAGTVNFTYDAAGNTLTREDARGVTVATKYDGVNRSIEQYEEGNRASTLTSWTYDRAGSCSECKHPEGRIATVTYPGMDGVNSDEFGYDQRGTQTWTRRTLEGQSFVTTRTLDNAQRAYETVFPDGTIVDRTYDGASRTIAVKGFIDSAEYGDRGKVKSVAFADGTNHQLSFDVRLDLAQRTVTDADGNVLQGGSFTRDRIGNLLQVMDLADDRANAITWASSHSYDAWYRNTDSDFGTGDDAYSLGYSFDALDNLVSVSGSRTDDAALTGDLKYSSSRPNAVVSGPNGLTLDYDASGAVIRRGETGLEWDHLGRLVGLTDGNYEPTVLGYGTAEERVTQSVRGGLVFHVSQDFEVRDGVSTTYVRFGKEVIARVQTLDLATEVLVDMAPTGGADGTINAGDAYLASSESGTKPSRYLRAAARRLLARSKPVFLHADHKSDITLATLDGDVIGEQSFYATGSLRERHGFVDVRGFGSQEHEEASGLIRHRFRYLDPTTGRWLSVDPAFLQSTQKTMATLGESTTGYAYVGNRFINHADPTGLLGERIKAAAGRVGAKIAAGGRAAGRGIMAAGRGIKAAGRWMKAAPGRAGRAIARSVRNKLAARRRPEFVYRLDGRTPQEMSQHGMRPYNVNANRPLMDHVRQNDYASQWTSTSRDVLIPGISPVGKYMYKIRLPDNGIDANTHFANHGEVNPYHAQNEYAIPGVIPTANIVGFMDANQYVQGLNTNNFQFNDLP